MSRKNVTQECDLGVVVVPNTNFTKYIGTREALINEGICTPDQFPEGRRRVKHAFNYGWSINKMKGGVFEFRQRHEHRDIREERGPKYETPESWRDYLLKTCPALSQWIWNIASGDDEKDRYGGVTIRYDDAALSEIHLLLSELDAVLRNGNVVWVGQAAKVKRMLPYAKANKPLQSFLQKMRNS